MKNFVYLVLALCVAFVSSCTESEDSGNISISGNKSISSSSEGGDFKVSFTAVDAWYASVTRVTKSDTLDWISISPDSGTAGECTVDVSVSPNNGSESRKAGIVISCAGETVTVTVTQKGSSDDEQVPDTASIANPKKIYVRTQNAGILSEGYALLKYADDKLTYLEVSSHDNTGEFNVFEIIEYDYSKDNTVILNEYTELQEKSEEDQKVYENTYVCALNADGMISSCETEGISLSYDEGRLVNLNIYFSDFSFLWDEGNLVTRHLVYKGQEESEIKYRYSDYHNNMNTTLDINWLLSGGYFAYLSSSYAGLAGLFGEKSENIIIPDALTNEHTNTISFDVPGYLLSSEDGKEVREHVERYYTSDDISFICEYESSNKLVSMYGEVDEIRDVYETVCRFVIDFEGRKEVVGGETRYYDYEIEQVRTENLSTGENVGKRFYEMRLEY